MHTEVLYVAVPSGKVKEFLQKDEEIWTPWLRNQKGFLSKDSMVSSSQAVVIRIFWRSKKDMEAAAKARGYKETENRFNAAVGPYRIIPLLQKK